MQSYCFLPLQKHTASSPPGLVCKGERKMPPSRHLWWARELSLPPPYQLQHSVDPAPPLGSMIEWTLLVEVWGVSSRVVSMGELSSLLTHHVAVWVGSEGEMPHAQRLRQEEKLALRS